MRAPGTGAGICILVSLLTLSSLPTSPFVQSAQATATRNSNTSGQLLEPTRQFAGKPSARAKTVAASRTSARGGISCVPFARNDSGIQVTGNAWQWWEKAEGSYARGSVPEPGSVLTFRSNTRMRLGHVAVVSRIVNPRVIEIEHANWAGPGDMRGSVARGTPVVDVSETNNWTAVRVGLGRAGEFGSVYPTYGFIYDRPDTGKLVTVAAAPAPKPELNPAPSDLRPVAERGWQTFEEVAEAPGVVVKRHRRGFDLSPSRLSTTAAPVVDRKE
jgi:surface antigen